MVDVISINIKEECAEEARGQNPQRVGTLTNKGLSSDKRRWQLGSEEVIKTTPVLERALFCRCCEQWQGESVLASSKKIERDREQIARM
jgi:hypothetical protein